jgi:hypothetical protein
MRLTQQDLPESADFEPLGNTPYVLQSAREVIRPNLGSLVDRDLAGAFS